MTELEVVPDWRDRSTMNVDEAAVILGISRVSAYEAVKRGDIPVLRVGRRLLVPTLPFRRMLGEIPHNDAAPGGQTERSDQGMQVPDRGKS